jgi:hypothetical protein
MLTSESADLGIYTEVLDGKMVCHYQLVSCDSHQFVQCSHRFKARSVSLKTLRWSALRILVTLKKYSKVC